MKESTQRRIIFLLLVGVIISLLWAIGSNSRKKVELEKSETLEGKIDKLVLSNTAIVSDLKSSRNRLSKLQHSERILKKNLAIETKKNETMEQTIAKATSSALGKSKSIEEFANDAAALKNTNIALGEEILNLKKRDAALKMEIEGLKAQLAQSDKNISSKTSRRKKQTKKEAQEKDSSNRNFNFK